MEAFCQKTHNRGYAEMVEAAFSDHGTVVPEELDCEDPQAKQLAKLFMKYYSAVFETRRPPGKKMPGTHRHILVFLLGNRCRVNLVCYEHDPIHGTEPLFEGACDDWELRDRSGTPDVAAAEAAMETLVKESLALCE